MSESPRPSPAELDLPLENALLLEVVAQHPGHNLLASSIGTQTRSTSGCAPRRSEFSAMRRAGSAGR
jgi:hypothetical protein